MTDLDTKVRDAMDRLAPTVGQAETVNVGVNGTIPHFRWIATLCATLFVGFSIVSLIVLLNDYDGLTKGLIIGTWNSTFVAMVSFWLGSSSGGKSQGVKP